jgi:hypothetical protein
VNLFFKGQTPTGATFDNATNSLIITGASGQIDKIPFGSNGISLFATPASTLSGFGEVSITPVSITPANFEGVGYYEHTSQQAGDAPVYRFFETTSGGHFFTASAAERDTVQATRSDMRFEGIAFFAPTT